MPEPTLVPGAFDVARRRLGVKSGAKERVGPAKRGDAKAIGELLEEHVGSVHRLVSLKLGRDDPALEDVVQESLIAAARGVGRLQGDDEAAFLRWLLTITRHKVADHYRERYSRRYEPMADPAAAAAVSGKSPEDLVISDQRDRRVREALTTLTSEQEEILTLKYVLGYDNEEIAQLTRRTVGAVKSMQHRALNRLAEVLAAEDGGWPARPAL